MRGILMKKPEPAPRPRPARGSVTSRDGATIGYRQLGAGPSLVLLHGGMQSAHNLLQLAEHLGDAFTLYVPDRRGRGMSGLPGGPYGVDRAVEDLEALLALSGARCVFAASVGGIIALQTALRSDRIEKLALYEPPLWVEDASPATWLPRFDREIAAGDLGAAFVTHGKGVEASPLFRFAPRFLLDPLFRLALEKQDTDVEGGEVALRALVLTMRADAQLVIETRSAPDLYRGITADLLLLGGGRSPASLRRATDALAAALKAQRITFPKLAHLGADNSGKPQMVAEELRRFFS